MTEFKRLSDVEVVAEPSETANVLIEENGIIKKAPKTAVGGGGEGGGYFITFDSSDNYKVFAATENLYEKIQEMFENYTVCDINIYNRQVVEENWVDYIKYGFNFVRKYDNNEYFYVNCGTYIASVYSDGRIEVQYYD